MAVHRQRSGDRGRNVAAALLATADRARWLAGFVNRDLATASDAEVGALRWEIQAFTYQRPGLDAVAEELFGTPKRRLSRGRPSRFAPSFLLEGAAAVRALHERLRDGVYSLLNHGEWSVSVKGDFGLRRAANGQLVMRAGGTPEVAFFLAVCELLQVLGSRVSLCPVSGCGRFMIAEGRQRFCSPQCSQRVRTARFKANHPGLLAERKHERYKGKTQAQLGKRVRVRRRPLERIRRRSVT
jgi:hypothetical protein